MNPIRRSLVVLTAVLMFGLLPLPTQAASLLDVFLPPAADTSAPKYRVEFVDGDRDSDDEVLLIRLRGVIQEKDDEDDMIPFRARQSMMERLKKDIEAALKRDQVKAILLDIDSPGGEVTASDIIYHRLGKLKEAKKPIVALFGTLGASGAFYVACAADKIMAHPTSLVGSIGVLMQSFNLEKLAGTLGLQHISLKSDRTPKKDILSPFREMTAEEEAMLLSIINGMYDRFLDIVAANRKKTREELAPLADGGIYTADQALKSGLIDAIGYQEDALEEAKKLAGLKSAKLVRRREKKSFSDFIGELAEMQSGAPAILSGLEALIQAGETPTLRFQMPVPHSR